MKLNNFLMYYYGNFIIPKCFFTGLMPVISNLSVSFAGVSPSQRVFALRLRNAEFSLDTHARTESISFAFACKCVRVCL